MLQIESDVPFPNLTETHSTVTKYPFRKMKVGDSIYFEGEESSKIYSAAKTYAHRTGVKFTKRKEGQGYRLWRIT